MSLNEQEPGKEGSPGPDIEYTLRPEIEASPVETVGFPEMMGLGQISAWVYLGIRKVYKI